MAILVDKDTQVLIQGATGKQGAFHTQKMLAYGVKVVAGVTPGKGGQKVHEVPVFDTVAEAKRHVRVDAAMTLVPPAGVLSAALEAIENRIPLIVAITEFVPTHDAMIIRKTALKEKVRIIGPNTIGIISPGKSRPNAEFVGPDEHLLGGRID